MKKRKEKHKSEKSMLLNELFKQQIDLKQKHSSRFTAANYLNTKHSVMRFVGDEADQFRVGEMTPDWMSDYVNNMQQQQHLSPGSADFYYRTLRAVYNNSVKQHQIPAPQEDLFKDIKITVPVTLKRALSVEEIIQLMEVDLSENKEKERARNFFLFLFFTRGMCFIDAFNLKKSDLSGGYIYYNRSKTNAPLSVQIIPEIQKLIDYFDEEDSPYIFPALHRNCYKKDSEVVEQTALRRTNRCLRRLGVELGFNIVLTTYVARHSWATLAEACGMNTGVISQALGHCSERVTKTYMKGMPSSLIDAANIAIINLLMNGGAKKKKKSKRCLALCKNETSVNVNL